MAVGPSVYTGRFAPSPTGPLHLGSLLTALASWLWARHAGGEWLVRIEDLDPPREPPGAALSILASLRAHGLSDRDIWDLAALTAFFNMSNRIASAVDMRPNTQYHAQAR